MVERPVARTTRLLLRSTSTTGQMSFRRRRSAIICGVLAVSFGLAGCSGGGASPTASASPQAWEDTLRETLTVARDHGASDDQLEIIRRGEVSFQEYQRAVARTIECLRDAGVDVVNDRVTEERGYPEIAYAYAATSSGRTEAETDSVSQACIRRHSLYVESLYFASPGVVEAEEERFEPYREAVVACLRDHDVSVSDDDTRQVLEVLNAELLYSSGVDCFLTAGFER